MVDKIVKDIITKKLPNLPEINNLYKSFIGMTNIENVGEEDFVMRELLRGTTKTQICELLKAKYPDTTFGLSDIDKFMARNDEIVLAMGKKINMSARRHLQAKTQLLERMASLALFTEKIIEEYHSKQDHPSTIAAIRAASDVLDKIGKIQGHTQPDNQTNIINVVNSISDSKTKSKILHKIHEANFVDANDGKIQ